MPKQPPNVNGVMTLTDAEITAIKAKLQEIQSRPPLTDENGDDLPWDGFWLVATYNKENVGAEINGDTAQYVLSEGDANAAGV